MPRSDRSAPLLRYTALALPGLLLAFAAFPSAPPQERLEIVDRAIEYHGGDVYGASATELELCSLSGCYEIAARVDGDRFEYRVEGAVREARLEVRSTNDGLELWVDGQAEPVPEGEAQRYADWAMARVYFPFLPYRLNDPEVYKQDLGLESWDGRQLRKVKVTFTPGSSTDASDEYLYWFDPETARLEQFAYSFEGNPGGLRFRRLSNYRRIGGILFFDQENLGMEAPGLSVEMVTPELVARSMRKVSQVELRDVRVRPLR